MYQENFFYDSDNSEFTITQEDLDIVNSLKSKTFESGYYHQMVTWSTKENPDIPIEKFNRAYIVMQFLSMIAEVKPELLIDLKLESHHISLLRGLYLEFGSYNDFVDDDSSKDDYIISMGYKRPFGNSYVLGDVLECMGEDVETVGQKVGLGVKRRYGIDVDEQEREILEEKAEVVLDEFAIFIDRFFKDGYILKYNDFIFHNRFKTTGFILSSTEKFIHWDKLGINFNPFGKITHLHSYLRSWFVNPSFIRDEKIKEILVD